MLRLETVAGEPDPRQLAHDEQEWHGDGLERNDQGGDDHRHYDLLSTPAHARQGESGETVDDQPQHHSQQRDTERVEDEPGRRHTVEDTAVIVERDVADRHERAHRVGVGEQLLVGLERRHHHEHQREQKERSDHGHDRNPPYLLPAVRDTGGFAQDAFDAIGCDYGSHQYFSLVRKRWNSATTSTRKKNTTEIADP